MDDPVYAEFLYPDWREAEQRVAAAEQRARSEAAARQAAEEALARLQAQSAGRQGDSD